MAQESEMQTYYSARAAEYDRVYAKPERQADLRSIEQWLTPRFFRRRVLEVACGTGYWTQFIAPAATSVVALDSSPETVHIARGRLPKQVTFLIDDAYTLSCVDGRFDAAFAGFWFSHIPLGHRRSFLEKLGSVLEPSATVVLLDNRFVQGSSTPISRTDADGNAFQIRDLDDGSRYEVLKNFPSEPELLAFIEGLGRAPRITNWQHFWALEYVTNPCS